MAAPALATTKLAPVKYFMGMPLIYANSPRRRSRTATGGDVKISDPVPNDPGLVHIRDLRGQAFHDDRRLSDGRAFFGGWQQCICCQIPAHHDAVDFDQGREVSAIVRYEGAEVEA